MDILETGKKIFKKGIKVPLFKIPLTREKPKVDHNIRSEFDRERTLNTLDNIKYFLQAFLPHATEFDRSKMTVLLKEVEELTAYLESYK